MTKFRYKAFISYSHRDEKWATWLHKALESYRLPRQLVGRTTRYGEVPAKFYPVFRDRDELSSGASLSDRVSEALAESESLIVVCSPAAAASRWVNEEIREFRRLGRGERIYCMVVDGDPQADWIEDSCFPPALLENEVGEAVEPMAADVRSWADGKSLAKLKLISGVLGVRLDTLRQREKKRLTQRRLFFAFGVVLAVALAVTAVLSNLAEQRQRELLAEQQAQAEEFAGFVVGMAGDLNAELSTETLAAFASQLYGHLESIDEALLTPETRKQVAKVLRTLGEVSLAKNQPVEALAAFFQSRDSLKELSAAYPENTEFLFELSQVQYHIGNLHYRQDDKESAAAAMEQYHNAAAELVRLEPDNPAWVLELAYSFTNMAAIGLKDLAMAEQSLNYVKVSIGLLESVIDLAPDNADYVSEYSSILSWAADAQLAACDVTGAIESRQKSVSIAGDLSASAMTDKNLRRRHAFALYGLSTAQRKAGLLEEAQRNLVHARDMIRRLSADDPGNINHLRHALLYDTQLADLRRETDGPGMAFETMSSLEGEYRVLMEDESASGPIQRDYAAFLLKGGGMAFENGNPEVAEEWIRESVEVLEDLLRTVPDSQLARRYLHEARYLWWVMKDHPLPGRFSELPQAFPLDIDDRSCDQADILARLYIIEDDRDNANGRVSYLLDRGYRDPNFLRFCRQKGLCQE